MDSGRFLYDTEYIFFLIHSSNFNFDLIFICQGSSGSV